MVFSPIYACLYLITHIYIYIIPVVYLYDSIHTVLKKRNMA